MPGPRLPMRRIRDVLRLCAAGMSKRQIAASLGVSATAAGESIRRARRAGLAWPLPGELSDEALEHRLYPSPTVATKNRRPQPDWAAIHCELRWPGVTLQLLWEEHRAVHPDGLQPLLRALPRLGSAAVADDAAEPCCRRAHVRRLRRHDAYGDRCG
jgi:transposase